MEPEKLQKAMSEEAETADMDQNPPFPGVPGGLAEIMEELETTNMAQNSPGYIYGVDSEVDETVRTTAEIYAMENELRTSNSVGERSGQHFHRTTEMSSENARVEDGETDSSLTDMAVDRETGKNPKDEGVSRQESHEELDNLTAGRHSPDDWMQQSDEETSSTDSPDKQESDDGTMGGNSLEEQGTENDATPPDYRPGSRPETVEEEDIFDLLDAADELPSGSIYPVFAALRWDDLTSLKSVKSFSLSKETLVEELRLFVFKLLKFDESGFDLEEMELWAVGEVDARLVTLLDYVEKRDVPKNIGLRRECDVPMIFLKPEPNLRVSDCVDLTFESTLVSEHWQFIGRFPNRFCLHELEDLQNLRYSHPKTLADAGSLDKKELDFLEQRLKKPLLAHIANVRLIHKSMFSFTKSSDDHASSLTATDFVATCKNLLLSDSDEWAELLVEDPWVFRIDFRSHGDSESGFNPALEGGSRSMVGARMLQQITRVPNLETVYKAFGGSVPSAKRIFEILRLNKQKELGNEDLADDWKPFFFFVEGLEQLKTKDRLKQFFREIVFFAGHGYDCPRSGIVCIQSMDTTIVREAFKTHMKIARISLVELCKDTGEHKWGQRVVEWACDE